MNRKRVTMLTLAAVLILTTGIFVSFLAFAIFGGSGKPIVLPSGGNAAVPASGEPYDFPSSAPVPVLPVSVTPETVQSVVKTLGRPDTYSCRFIVEDYWTDGQSSRARYVWVYNGYVRVDYYGIGGALENSAVTGGGQSYFWTPGSAQFYRGAAGNQTADDLQNIPTYEDLLALDKGNITAAQYTTLGDDDCIYVSAYVKELGYTDKYWISVNSGLLVLFERNEADKVVYRAAMDSLDLTKPDDERFILPNHELVWSVK